MNNASINIEIFRDFIETKACIFAADDDVYMKFLQKQASLDNNDAIRQLSSMVTVKSNIDHLYREIEKLNIIGLSKLYCICEMVKTKESPKFEIHDKWTVCSVSGMPTNQCVMLGKYLEWNVDISYLPFFDSLWIISHLDNIEYSRFISYLEERPVSEKILDSLKFLSNSSNYVSDETIQRYIEAFHSVLSVIETTTKSYIINNRI